ncbi:MAG: hypothetical protein N838_25710 [Thiohalocapsa sp. PB-PSB1]|jgi:hypothetical protein|nr:MAG: hypothetical protein N838_25710 [Thiohalocapsa sp. PB-PSB1]
MTLTELQGKWSDKGPGSVAGALDQLENAQQTRQPDAKLRRALRASPQFGAGCG